MRDLNQFLIEYVFPNLSLRQQKCVMYRQRDVFGFGENSLTYKAISIQEGVCVERIRQITIKAKHLISHRLMQIAEAQKSPHVIIKEVTKKEMIPNLPMRQKFFYDLGELSTRSFNCLTVNDCMLVDKLLEKSEADLLAMPNIGRKSVNEIKEILAHHGLKLKTSSAWRKSP